MLSKSQITAASGPCTIIGAPAPSSEASKKRCDRAIAPRPTPSRRESKTIRRQNCSAGKSRPPARPGRSTSMSTARWPDASCPRPSSPMAARLRWRETRCASPSPNSPFAWRPICRRDHSPTRCRRCWTRSARCIRRSRFRIHGSPISSARGRADHRGQCLRAFVRAGRAGQCELARARSRRGKACRSRCGQSNSSVTAGTCSAIPGLP